MGKYKEAEESAQKGEHCGMALAVMVVIVVVVVLGTVIV